MDECTGCAYVIQNRPSSAFMSTVSGWNVQRAGSARNESEPRIKTNLVNNREILKIKPKLFKSKYNNLTFTLFHFTKLYQKLYPIPSQTTILPPIQFLLWCCNFHSCRQPRPLFESRLKLLSHPLPTPVPFCSCRGIIDLGDSRALV